MSVNTNKGKDDNHARSNPETTEKEQKTPKGVASPRVGVAHTSHSQTPSILQSPYRGVSALPQQPSSTQPIQSQKTTSIPSLSALNESIQRPHSASTAPSSPQRPISDPGLLTLLGPNVSSFPFSELAFIEAMKLRTEQERTKQEFYRAESANKTLSIIQLALQAQVPPNQIPQLLAGGVPGSADDTKSKELNVRLPYQFPLSHQSPAYSQPARWVNPQLAQPRLLLEQQIQMIQAQQRQIQFNLQQQQQQQQMHLQQASQVMSNVNPQLPQKRASSTDQDITASPMQPKGFKFGGNIASNTSQERPQSPAKIGATAVANLNAPTTPFRVPRSTSSSTGRRTRGHQRYNSMPVLASTSEGTLSIKTRSLRHDTLASEKSSPFLQSPSGARSTLQVNPIPAQPLNEQKKQQAQPLQESMQSFQHVIQFHHWQPELGSASSSINKSPSHKRHKSMTREDMSSTYREPESSVKSVKHEFTAGQNYASEKSYTKEREIIADEEDDADLSVETSMVDVATKKDELAHPPSQGHSRQELNIGRYPHDILSANH